VSDLRQRARGRWLGILPSLGIDSRYLPGKHCPCPICREGKDRFRFDDKDGLGTWICSICGAGDGISLVMKVNGWTFKQAAVEIEKHIGAAVYRLPKPERSSTEKRRDMNSVWMASEPVQIGDPVALYLQARCGISTFPPCIRTAHRLRYYDAEAGTSFHPAMVAMVVDAAGKPVNIHRTYLTGSGAKAAVPEPRRTMPGDLPRGCAIRLADHSGVLGIAEGIETALSANALFNIPTWSVVNTAIMARWVVPSDVHELIIFADNDANYSGQAAAYDLANRVVTANPAVTVRIPPVPDTDWNDVHQQKNLAA